MVERGKITRYCGSWRVFGIIVRVAMFWFWILKLWVVWKMSHERVVHHKKIYAYLVCTCNCTCTTENCKIWCWVVIYYYMLKQFKQNETHVLRVCTHFMNVMCVLWHTSRVWLKKVVIFYLLLSRPLHLIYNPAACIIAPPLPSRSTNARPSFVINVPSVLKNINSGIPCPAIAFNSAVDWPNWPAIQGMVAK